MISSGEKSRTLISIEIDHCRLNSWIDSMDSTVPAQCIDWKNTHYCRSSPPARKNQEGLVESAPLQSIRNDTTNHLDGHKEIDSAIKSLEMLWLLERHENRRDSQLGAISTNKQTIQSPSDKLDRKHFAVDSFIDFDIMYRLNRHLKAIPNQSNAFDVGKWDWSRYHLWI